MDRLREMQVMLAVADAPSFAVAGRRLGLSPAAVTRAVAGVEERLGVRLVSRTTRSMRLTEAGLRFTEGARRALEAVETAELTAMGETAEPRGHLSITASTSFGRVHVGPILAEFLVRNPGMTASILAVDRVVNLVEEGIDVGVRIGRLPDSRLIARRVGETRRVLVAAPDYLARAGTPLRPEDLSDHALIVHEGMMGGVTAATGGRGSLRGIAITPRLVVNDVFTTLSLVEAGHGIAPAFCYMVADALMTGRLVEVLADDTDVQPVHLVHPETRLISPAVRAFLDVAAPLLKSRLAVYSRDGAGVLPA
ncbi:MAG: LysR substrate-binding domain-containing protein [Pseudomonadota bacterium]